MNAMQPCTAENEQTLNDCPTEQNYLRNEQPQSQSNNITSHHHPHTNEYRVLHVLNSG